MDWRKNNFTIDDFMSQMEKLRDRGTISKIMDLIPGMKETGVNADEIASAFRRIQALYHSMNKDERQHPERLNPYRHHRICKGAGVGLADLHQFLTQFEMSRKMATAALDAKSKAPKPSRKPAARSNPRGTTLGKLTCCKREVEWYDFG